MGDEIVLCKDCKHRFVPIANWILPAEYRGLCRKSYTPAHQEFNVVTGMKKVPAKYEGCSTFRIKSTDCGPQAKFWEPKDPKKFFTLLKRI